ncbi:MAG TPA: peptidyl-tRNA hydrolase Pth2 [Thermoplasmata archaeon]|nr:peptidyl-tRNA hydrolase Pth2 [Thermoplasmata archaeon]
MTSSRGRASPASQKMVLIIRGELRLTAGKAAVQAAHAAVLLVRRAETHSSSDLDAWLAEGQKKVALEVATLEEMEAIQRKARAAGIPTTWVEDAGFTEVAPGTRTCLGLGPAPASELDPITGDLPLL